MPKRFLSTPSARRATGKPHNRASSFVISIHALREEGDALAVVRNAVDVQFLSTPSARRATRYLDKRSHENIISIHALREEGDSGM